MSLNICVGSCDSPYTFPGHVTGLLSLVECLNCGICSTTGEGEGSLGVGVLTSLGTLALVEGFCGVGDGVERPIKARSANYCYFATRLSLSYYYLLPMYLFVVLL